jgi:hypothetical protein
MSSVAHFVKPTRLPNDVLSDGIRGTKLPWISERATVYKTTSMVPTRRKFVVVPGNREDLLLDQGGPLHTIFSYFVSVSYQKLQVRLKNDEHRALAEALYLPTTPYLSMP